MKIRTRYGKNGLTNIVKFLIFFVYYLVIVDSDNIFFLYRLHHQRRKVAGLNRQRSISHTGAGRRGCGRRSCGQKWKYYNKGLHFERKNGMCCRLVSVIVLEAVAWSCGEWFGDGHFENIYQGRPCYRGFSANQAYAPDIPQLLAFIFWLVLPWL